MIVHIFEGKKSTNKKILTNCKMRVKTANAVKVALDDENICETCRQIHEARPSIPRLSTFAFREFETEEEEKEADGPNILVASACG